LNLAPKRIKFFEKQGKKKKLKYKMDPTNDEDEFGLTRFEEKK